LVANRERAILKLKLNSPAKVNLFLRILRKRLDGYHDLVSLMCCLDLSDEIILDFAADRIFVSCDYPGVPQNKTNLACQAAACFLSNLKKKTGLSHPGIGIQIKKKIPPGAGLGGGSSNAATVLLGLNYFFKQPFSSNELIMQGLTIGADVPFFMGRQPAIATGVGETLTTCLLQESLSLLLIYPGFSVSTPRVYKKFNLRLTKSKKKANQSDFGMSDFGKQYCGIKNLLVNDLEKVAFDLYPEIAEVKKALCDTGAKGALMAGSGSSVFGIFRDADAVKKAEKNIVKKHNWQFFHTKLDINPGYIKFENIAEI